ncbi:C39 family peptidase [Paenibacillus radicis (ex Xue et al. 2023)]|uniref:C39 family peptidase n=1 Tax=Paenibacillus radicis (ex Xue et al. 2023) TaxID=2972489 RepID=A0ABT1YK56_9BACL|nr:C39 family peptidase [Paenibacillus radicis (ex Xue et al. 2023)]MCR8633574.1 C39 family peptidase [Paenibacillus radicis (ex Xue et al. 2023)]
MKVLWKGIQVTFGFFLIAGLLFASGVFTILLYARITGQAWFEESSPIAYAETVGTKQPIVLTATVTPPEPPAKSAMLDAPVVRQLPELPSGCEVTSLTMMFLFFGIQKDKMELVPEMKRDTTPLRRGKNGAIAYWGNPNTGFVGEVTAAGRGFGIYHGALFELQKQYIPKAVDLTGQPFEKLEQQLREGIPSVVWTTIDYRVPEKWNVWDTPIGPIQTTFMEHAVLLVGFDEQNVYVNDPLSGQAKIKIDKGQFLETWEVMGKQALSYLK